jgi:hypothetical protein
VNRIEVYCEPASLLSRIRLNADYAGVCVKPRMCRDACAHGGGWRISRLNVSRLSQTVEGLELVFGERLGVDGGSGGVDRLPHHVQGRKGVERCCGGSGFVAEVIVGPPAAFRYDGVLATPAAKTTTAKTRLAWTRLCAAARSLAATLASSSVIRLIFCPLIPSVAFSAAISDLHPTSCDAQLPARGPVCVVITSIVVVLDVPVAPRRRALRSNSLLP